LTSSEICDPERTKVNVDFKLKVRKKVSLRQLMLMEKQKALEKQKLTEKVNHEIQMIGNCKIYLFLTL
jgi:hypothetical protein